MLKTLFGSFSKEKKIAKYTGRPSNIYKDFHFIFHKEEFKEENGVKKSIQIYKKYGYNNQTKEADFIGLVEK